MKPSVLMTYPSHFAIRAGANPHTRNDDNSLKTVDQKLAMKQWNRYVDTLLDAGVDVYVIDAEEGLTGMVFAANAGFLKGRLSDLPASQKTFFPSHFTAEHRMGESEKFSAFMNRFGFEVIDYPDQWRWEGEADAFPLGRGDDQKWVFTHGFRSDPDVGDWVESAVLDEPVTRLELADPRYYHGDTALCDLGGPCLMYRDAFTERSQEVADELLGDRIINIDDEDAEAFLGNSFFVVVDGQRFLFVADGVREKTQDEIRERGLEVIPVDISEFFGKGGGGPKCMVFNLGECHWAQPGLTQEHSAFRRVRHIEKIRERRGRGMD